MFSRSSDHETRKGRKLLSLHVNRIVEKKQSSGGGDRQARGGTMSMRYHECTGSERNPPRQSLGQKKAGGNPAEFGRMRLSESIETGVKRSREKWMTKVEFVQRAAVVRPPRRGRRFSLRKSDRDDDVDVRQAVEGASDLNLAAS